MSALFKLVLTSSLYASIVGLIILMVKALLKNKINGKWQYAIWFILVFKLLFPFGPKSALSLFNAAPVHTTEKIVNERLIIVEEKNVNEEMTPVNLNNNTPIPMAGKSVKASVPMIDILSYMWFGIFVAMMGWIVGTNLLLRSKLKSTTYFNERIKETFNNCKKRMEVKGDIELVVQDKVLTPALFGVIKPRILLSSYVLNFKEKDIEYILLHELAHYKRKDIVANYLLILLQCIHWFNPVLWYCFKRIRMDIEVAADEMVITTLKEDEYKDYGKALLAVLENMSCRKMIPKLMGMVDDKKGVKRRIEMIKMANYFKSKRRMAIIIGVLCIAILSTILLTSGVGSKESDNGSALKKVDTTYDAKTLLKYKSKYIGDASNVSILLGNLPFGESKRGISLQTETTPYTMIVNYDLTEYLNKDTEVNISQVLTRNAFILFSLIDNLEGVKYMAKYGNDDWSCYVARGELQKYFDKDLREYSKDKIEFERYLSSVQDKNIEKQVISNSNKVSALKSDKEENNKYFFKDISLNNKQFTCEGVIWGDVKLPNDKIEDITKEEEVKANLVVTEVAKLIKGKVYEFKFSIQEAKVNPVYKEQEVFLWVTRDEIYKLSPKDNFNVKDFVINGHFDNIGYIKMLEEKGELPSDNKSLICCSSQNMKFKESENSLWKTEISVKDNICTYVRSHNSGHYEKFVWEQDKGLTNYSWGQGALRAGMRLTIIK